MFRLVICFALGALVACAGKDKKDTQAVAGSGAIYAKKLALSWGISESGTQELVYLQTTDETGKQTSFPLGSYDGICKVFNPSADMNAVTGVSCTVDGSPTGTELHAVVQGEDIIILKLVTQQGTAPDPMARTEVTRVSAPTGAKVEVGS
jgi:hypothetical protein